MPTVTFAYVKNEMASQMEKEKCRKNMNKKVPHYPHYHFEFFELLESRIHDCDYPCLLHRSPAIS